jgi:fructose-bisphosphate aldolase class I
MNTSSLKEQQQRKIKTQPGFFAALDQSGGSTPKALRTYGIKEGAWSCIVRRLLAERSK